MKNLKGITLAIISSATFGMIALFSIPLMEQGMNIGSILFYRFLLSSFLMGAVCFYRKESLKISLSRFTPLILLGVLYAATSLLLIHSYEWVPSGIVTTIHFLYPVLVSIIMVIFFKERGSMVLFGAALISLVGVVFLCWSDTQNIHIKGVITASLTIFTYALYIVGVNQTKTGQQMKAEPLTFYILFFSTILFFIYALASGGLQTVPDVFSFGRLAALAVLSTVISDLTLVLAIKHIGSTVTSILGSMEPLVAVFIGVLYFSETFTGYTLLGVVLIIAGVCLVVKQSAKRKKYKEGIVTDDNLSTEYSKIHLDKRH